jgi:hypothetical protein
MVFLLYECLGQKSFSPTMREHAGHNGASQVSTSPSKVLPISKSQSSVASMRPQELHLRLRAFATLQIATPPFGILT